MPTDIFDMSLFQLWRTFKNVESWETIEIWKNVWDVFDEMLIKIMCIKCDGVIDILILNCNLVNGKCYLKLNNSVVLLKLETEIMNKALEV